MHPTILRAFTDYDSPDVRIIFAHISSDQFGVCIQKSFPSEGNSISFTSEPLFALYRNKECVRIIKAVDAPKLYEEIAAFIPKLVVIAEL